MTAARDAAAFKQIYDTRAARVRQANKRAESWIAGLTALVTVLATAMVISGPDNFAKADGAVRVVVLVFVVAGAAGIGTGLVLAYTAAFGGIFAKSATDELLEQPPQQAAGAADLLERASNADARSSRTAMQRAILATVAAMLCLVLAVVFAWFATPTPTKTDWTCLATESGIARITGDIEAVSGDVTIVECP